MNLTKKSLFLTVFMVAISMCFTPADSKPKGKPLALCPIRIQVNTPCGAIYSVEGIGDPWNEGPIYSGAIRDIIRDSNDFTDIIRVNYSTTCVISGTIHLLKDGEDVWPYSVGGGSAFFYVGHGGQHTYDIDYRFGN